MDNLEDCDIAREGNEDARCGMDVGLAYANQFVISQETRPGIGYLDIWLNAGAIIGSVQFFAWFAVVAIGC